MVDFLPTARHYMEIATQERVASIAGWAISKGKVTLNRSYQGSGDDIRGGQTLFEGLTIAPPKIPMSIRGLIDKGSPVADNKPTELIKALECVIEQSWRPDRFHLICHSSGYDSRIVSYLIKRIAERRGKSWLGDILFVCWKPEIKQFRQIMAYEGWAPECQATYREDAADHEYFAELVKFDTFWRWVNDAQPCVWPDLLFTEQLVESGRIPCPLSEVQQLAGFGGNECLRLPTKDLLEHFYYHRWAARYATYPFEIIRPFTSYEVLRLVKPTGAMKQKLKRNPLMTVLVQLTPPILLSVGKHTARSMARAKRELLLAKQKGIVAPVMRDLSGGQRSWYESTVDFRTKAAMVNQLSPELWAIERGPNENTHPVRFLRNDIRLKCVVDFTSSWYYKKVIEPIDPQYGYEIPESILTQDWWAEYAKASLCEYLVNKGVKIALP